ncbi:MAG: hypothetical protein IPJ69_12620 [Deltaproteobacteria bacterium]|nr:MAG: hypothetical protein IPJ69_12620 [Deltaproteobacteria bacterium]
MTQRKTIQHFFKSLSGEKERYVCALNGVFGDSLEKKKPVGNAHDFLY